MGWGLRVNRVFIVGNITSNIYLDHFLIRGQKRSFLRLILMASRPRRLVGVRVILWDEKAELYFPYLKKGSELAILGQLESRQYKEHWIQEVVADHLLLLRNIDWENGEAVRKDIRLPDPGGSLNDTFLIGEVLQGFQLERLTRRQESGGGDFALLRLKLNCTERLAGLRTVVRGSLAELVYPYLQIGSKIAVDGFLQSRDLETGKQAFELVVRNMLFIDRINWSAGQAAEEARAKMEGGAEEVEAWLDGH